SIPELLSHRRRLEQLQKEVPVGSISDIEGRVVRADYPTSSDNPENSDSRPHAIHDHLPGRDLLVAFQRLRADRFIRYVIVRDKPFIHSQRQEDFGAGCRTIVSLSK